MSTPAIERRPHGNVYGRIVTGHDVERSSLDVLRAHMARYLRETERQGGRTPGQLPAPRGYIVASQFERWPEDQVPVVVVVSPGLVEPPRTHGDGTVDARWSLAAGIIVTAATQDRARENGMVYTAAMRVLLGQHQALDGLANGIEWLDESYDVAPFNVRRSLWAAQVICVVTVENAAQFLIGARDGHWPPDPVPPTDAPRWPVVTSASVRLTLDTNHPPLEEDPDE